MPTDSGSQDSAGRKTTAAASSEPSALNREGIDGVRLSGFACRELGLQGTVVGEAPAMHLLDLLGRRLLLKQAHGVAKLSQGVVLELLGRAVAGAIHLRLGRDQLVQELALAVLLARLRVRLRHREGLPERAAALGSDHDHSRARRSLEDELPFLRREVSLSRHRHSFGRLFSFRWATPDNRSRTPISPQISRPAGHARLRASGLVAWPSSTAPSTSKRLPAEIVTLCPRIPGMRASQGEFCAARPCRSTSSAEWSLSPSSRHAW